MQLDQMRTLPLYSFKSLFGFRKFRQKTFRQKTFRQKHGGGRFGKKIMPKRLRLQTFAETFRMICGHIRCMHARPHRRKDQLPLRLLRDLRSR